MDPQENQETLVQPTETTVSNEHSDANPQNEKSEEVKTNIQEQDPPKEEVVKVQKVETTENESQQSPQPTETVTENKEGKNQEITQKDTTQEDCPVENAEAKPEEVATDKNNQTPPETGEKEIKLSPEDFNESPNKTSTITNSKEDALGFDLFVKERQKELGLTNENLREIDTINKLYQEWKDLGTEEKKKYIDMAIEKEKRLQQLSQALEQKAIKAEENNIKEESGESEKEGSQIGLAKKKFDLLMTQIKTMFGLHYMKNDNMPAEIIPGLFLGSIGAALTKKSLIDLGITHILCCCDNVKAAFPNDFVYKILPLLDKPSEDIRKYFEEAADYIHQLLAEEKKILVHCFAGKSRSTTILIAYYYSYLLKYHGMTTDQALEEIRKKRPVAGPNLGI